MAKSISTEKVQAAWQMADDACHQLKAQMENGDRGQYLYPNWPRVRLFSDALSIVDQAKIDSRHSA